MTEIDEKFAQSQVYNEQFKSMIGYNPSGQLTANSSQFSTSSSKVDCSWSRGQWHCIMATRERLTQDHAKKRKNSARRHSEQRSQIEGANTFTLLGDCNSDSRHEVRLKDRHSISYQLSHSSRRTYPINHSLKRTAPRKRPLQLQTALSTSVSESTSTPKKS